MFQHGENLEHYWRAHELAKRAAELGDTRARWLAAAALDRWLMRQDKPQKYGTQYHEVDGRWVLWDVDPTTSDQERAAWDVPSLSITQRTVEQMSAGRDLTDMFLEDPPLATLAVPGLRVEIKRWLGPSPPRDRPKPQPVPLAPLDAMAPDYLPPDLLPARLDGGFCAIDGSGHSALSWRAFPLTDKQVFVSGWLDEFGPAPTLEAATSVSGHAAIWIGAGRDTPEQLVVPTGAAQCWVVSGELSRDELLRVAASLPPPP